MVELTALVTCEECGTDYDGHWSDSADTVQDLAEAPVAQQQCPSCGHEQEEAYSGWLNFTEAG